VALRERHPPQPVIGMTEAALLTAALRAEPLGLLTLGAALLPLYRQRVAQIGLAAWLAACERLHDAGAHAITLARALLCGYAEALQARCAPPVFDGVDCAVRQARLQLGLRSGG
jgi:allantoin racemase